MKMMKTWKTEQVSSGDFTLVKTIFGWTIKLNGEIVSGHPYPTLNAAKAVADDMEMERQLKKIADQEMVERAAKWTPEGIDKDKA